MEDGFTRQEGNEYLDIDGDEASIRFGDSEEEMDNDSVMMVRTCITKMSLHLWSHLDSIVSFILYFFLDLTILALDNTAVSINIAYATETPIV